MINIAERIPFSWKPLSFSEQGTLLSFGFPVIGGWLPYIGGYTTSYKGEREGVVLSWLMMALIFEYE